MSETIEELTKRAVTSKLNNMDSDYIREMCDVLTLDYNILTHYKIAKLYGIALTSLAAIMESTLDTNALVGAKNTADITRAAIKELFGIKEPPQ